VDRNGAERVGEDMQRPINTQIFVFLIAVAEKNFKAVLSQAEKYQLEMINNLYVDM